MKNMITYENKKPEASVVEKKMAEIMLGLTQAGVKLARQMNKDFI